MDYNFYRELVIGLMLIVGGGIFIPAIMYWVYCKIGKPGKEVFQYGSFKRLFLVAGIFILIGIGHIIYWCIKHDLF